MPEASPGGGFQFATASGLSDRAYKRWLTAVVALAGVIRIVYVIVRLHDQVADSLDQYWYQNTATLIADGRGISNPQFFAEKGILTPTALHLPLTSFLLVPFDLIGLGKLGEHQVLIAIIGTATVLILGMLVSRLVSREAGVVTAFVAAVYPGMWGFDVKVMSEPVEQFLVALMLLFAYLFRYQPTAFRGVCLGASVGLAVLTRSELVLEVPFLLVPLCIGAFKGRFNRDFVFKAALVFGSVAVVVGPWIYYCETAFHDPEVFSQISASGSFRTTTRSPTAALGSASGGRRLPMCIHQAMSHRWTTRFSTRRSPMRGPMRASSRRFCSRGSAASGTCTGHWRPWR